MHRHAPPLALFALGTLLLGCGLRWSAYPVIAGGLIALASAAWLVSEPLDNA